GMSQAREVVRWAFDEKRKVGDISPVFEVDGKYIVAKLTEKREKGTPTLEQVKEFIEPLAKRDKKAEKIIAEINKEITSPSTLSTGYRMLGMKADTTEIVFGASNLPGYGREDDVIGKVFAMKAGEMSRPIQGNQGVFVVAVDAIIPAPPKDDYTTEKRMLNNAFQTRSQRETTEALKRMAKIEDNRLMFY
ncbi:MAG: peptidylprolyl isomerase, partial [Lentimicrobiaceae bacterium]|nr:peptidylprolyl isomerase [Lentimicrobiaceae bacterium]